MGIVQEQAKRKAQEQVDSRFSEPALHVSSRRVTCPYCSRLICEGNIRTIRVKCPSCKQFSTIRQVG